MSTSEKSGASEKIKGHLNIRIPISVTDDVKYIAGIEHRKVIDMSAVMIQEYTPIKKKIVQPFAIQRDVQIGGTTFRFGPGNNPNELSINIVTQNPFSITQLYVGPADKENILDLIANLLVFSNTI